MRAQTTIRTLDDLFAVLTTEPNTRETADAYGLPRSPTEDAIDWTDLPTFGGEEPSGTLGVWSWDETRLLVSRRIPGFDAPNALQAAAQRLTIVPREAI